MSYLVYDFCEVRFPRHWALLLLWGISSIGCVSFRSVSSHLRLEWEPMHTSLSLQAAENHSSSIIWFWFCSWFCYWFLFPHNHTHIWVFPHFNCKEIVYCTQIHTVPRFEVNKRLCQSLSSVLIGVLSFGTPMMFFSFYTQFAGDLIKHINHVAPYTRFDF